jgi:hypothetical protein
MVLRVIQRQVNPTRLEELGDPMVDLAQNTQNVLFVASQVLHSLRTSIHYCPMYVELTEWIRVLISC